MRAQVEFAQHYRIGATARQLQDGADVSDGNGRGPAPGPVFALPRRQRVEVEQDVPLRRLVTVTVERCRAPQAARVLGVFPEIEDFSAAPGDQRDVVGPVEDRRERVAIGGEARIAETRQGRGVLRFDPGQRRLTVDLFEPKVRIVVGRFQRRARIGHRILISVIDGRF